MATRSWGRRLAVSALVLVVVLVGLLIVADRVGAWYAERTVADQVQQEISARGITTDKPDVSVGGFPFLTQVLSGRYEKISILLRDVEGGGIRLPQLDVTARGVTAALKTIRTGQGEVRADRITGTATVGYSTVAALTNQPGLRLSGQDGQLRVRLPVEILGQQVTLVGVAKVQIDKDSRIRVTVSELDDESGNLPAQARRLADQYARDLSVNFRLPELPFNLTLNQVEPQPEGLAVTASASGVPLVS